MTAEVKGPDRMCQYFGMAVLGGHPQLPSSGLCEQLFPKRKGDRQHFTFRALSGTAMGRLESSKK